MEHAARLHHRAPRVANATDGRVIKRASLDEVVLGTTVQPKAIAHPTDSCLRTWLGRIIRDVQRKGGEISGALEHKIATAQRLCAQRRDSKNKLYAPETECIAMGKVRTPYEF